jgi:hypothetical protein
LFEKLRQPIAYLTGRRFPSSTVGESVNNISKHSPIEDVGSLVRAYLVSST